MSEQTIGILGGGQLGSLLCLSAKKLNLKTVIYCNDIDAPAQNYANQFICGDYKDKIKIQEFISKVDVVTYEFENIPYVTLNEINKLGANLTILELGCFCGYSAILMANNLGAQGKVISIEINNNYASIANEIIEFAGLKNKVIIIEGPSEKNYSHSQI